MLPEVPRGFADPEVGARAHRHLLETGYTERALGRLSRGFTLDVADPRLRNSLLPAADPATPLGILLRLFALGADVPASSAESALRSVTLPEWEEAGLLDLRSDGTVRSRVTLGMFTNLIVASDRHPEEHRDPTTVMAVSLSTLSLARLMIPGPPVARAADIGCGNGFLALVLARGAAEVIATDSQPRALAFTELNARWNGVQTIRTELGDGIAPLEGVRVDRIVSNPPFVLGPERGYHYAHAREGFVEELVRDLPRVLADAGTAQLLAHWAFDPDDPAAVLKWFDAPPTAGKRDEDPEVDAQIWCSRTIPVEAYIQQWAATDTSVANPGPEWLSHFTERGISQVAEGLLNVRATMEPGPKLRSLDPAPPRMDAETPKELAVGFRRQRFLRRHSGEALRRAVVGPHPGIQIVQETEAQAEGWAPPRLRLARTQAIARSRPIDPAALSLVTRSDRSTPLGDIVDAIESEGGRSDGPPLLEVARELIALGFLDGPDFHADAP